MTNLALVLQNMGKYAEAEQMYRQALERMEEGLGDGHPTTKLCRNNLAKCVRAEEEAGKRGDK